GKSSSSSMGSRGSRTMENNGAQPIARTAQTPQSTNPVAGAPSPAMAGGGSFFQRHPFLTGLAGGFLGSMLFSHLGGFGTALGGILPFLLIGLLIFFLIRLFMGRGFGFARSGGPAPAPMSVGAAAAPAPRYRGHDTTVADADLDAFQGVHAAVQEAWSRN